MDATLLNHRANMFVHDDVDPITLHCYIVKFGFYMRIHYFLIFALKHRLWVIVRTASVRPTINVLSKNLKIITAFYLKIIIISREISQYIAQACFRNGMNKMGSKWSPLFCSYW